MNTRYLLLTLALSAAAPLTAANLEVTIDAIRVQQGTLQLAVYDSADAWQRKAKPLAGRRVAPDGSAQLRVVFPDLAPGRYAVRVMHDENGNGKLDSNLLGIPKEGYGASNNPQVMRAPRFDESAFELGDADHAIRIELN